MILAPTDISTDVRGKDQYRKTRAPLFIELERLARRPRPPKKQNKVNLRQGNLKNPTMENSANSRAELSTPASGTREQIIEAADRRIRQYGYAKTTMTEIATDCSMSAANLYRYFTNKADLISVLAQGCLKKRLAHMDAVFQEDQLTTSQRVEKWIIETAEWTYREWSDIPHISRLVNDVCTSKPEIVRNQHGEIRARVLSLIETGMRRQEIEPLDEQARFDLANAIVTATAVFSVPYFMHVADLEAHRRSALRVSMMINRALTAQTA